MKLTTPPSDAAKASISNIVFDTLPHPILFLDPQLQVQALNHAAEAFFQTSQKVMQGKALRSLFSEDAPILSLAEQSLRRKVPIFEYRLALKLRGRQAAPFVDVSCVPVMEKIDGLLLMLLERTTPEMIDRQFAHKSASRTVSGLSAMLAHEVKNPLFGIRGAAQLLENTPSQNDRDLARLIRQEADRIVRLMEQMDAFADSRPLARAPLNIHAVLERVKSIAQSSFARHVPIHEEYDPSLPYVYANEDQLIQLFLNLVKNAAEALENHPKPELRLRTAFRPGVHMSLPATKSRISLPLEVCVEDNGPGIPSDLLPHLFDPFVSTKTNGAGLGLAIAAKLVEDHGGIIDFQSGADGTIFRVLMPLHQEPENR